MRHVFLVVVAALAAGCGAITERLDAPRSQGEAQPDPVEQPSAATASVAAAPAGRLGSSIASLGAASMPGLWLETPLVRAVRPGEVRVPATGARLAVELRPIDGPDTAGSRLSLAAMRDLGLPLTDLAEIEVFADG